MSQKRIVIAEDETLIRMNLKEALTGLGYLVVGEAVDGESAVKLARELRPDLMVMDIKMPKLDGLEAAAVLTEERIAPVMLLTAYGSRDQVERARDTGVVAYLIKPFREADLVPAIEVAMARYAELRALDKQIDDLQQAMATRKLIERAKGLLMRKDGIAEAEAFRRIQRLSMNTRKPMKEIAEAILIAGEIEL
jgi:response regulator NasT